MKKKKKRISSWILLFFVGMIGGYSIPVAYMKGRNLTIILIGLGVLFLVVVGNFFYNRLSARASIPWDKGRKKALGL